MPIPTVPSVFNVTKLSVPPAPKYNFFVEAALRYICPALVMFVLSPPLKLSSVAESLVMFIPLPDKFNLPAFIVASEGL